MGASELAIASRSVVVDGRRFTVVAVSPLAEAAHSVAAILRASAIGAPLLLLLVAAVTWRATGRTLRPIDRIRAEVDELSSTTLSRRVPVPNTHDEVASLARTMNTMLARLEDAHARQDAFVSDASHELRSPVATIRTQLEVALLHPDSSEWRAVARDVLEEAGRMERLIGDLLLLARLDATLPPATEAATLADVIAAVAQRVDDDRLTVQTTGTLAVCGRSTQLEIALGNLVDNALRHAASRVEVCGSTDAVRVVVVVGDDGPGIPDEDRARVFERFTRLDEGRSRVDGGIGLGLAVAQRVVQHHGGSLTVGESRLGGAEFRIDLPAGQAVPSAPDRSAACAAARRATGTRYGEHET